MAIVGEQLLIPESGYTRYLFTDTTFEYATGWTANASNDRVSSTIGSTIKFNFFGASIYILVFSWSNRGKLSISIDGKPSVEYNANHGVNANDYVAFIEDNLEEKWHYVEITLLTATGSFRGVDVKGIIAPYDESIFKKKLILKNPTTNQHYSLAEKTLIPLPDSSPKNMTLHGIEAGKEIQLDEDFDKIHYFSDSYENLSSNNKIFSTSVNTKEKNRKIIF